MYYKILLTKIEELPDAEVPNNIPTNDFRVGITENLPVKNHCFSLYCSSAPNSNKIEIRRSFRTSPVQEVLDNNTFKTFNSIYEYKVLDTNEDGTKIFD